MADNKTDGGAAEVQKKVDAEQEVGYQGEVPDKTPNENYTLKGVVAGLPVPEVDRDAAVEAGRPADTASELAPPKK